MGVEVFDDFYIVYQPIFFALTGGVLGHEAFLRHPSGAGPVEILAAARGQGALPAWECRILERVLDEISRGPRPGGLLFLNLTPEAFGDRGFPEMLARMLAGAGLEPGEVVVEATDAGAIGPEGFERALEGWLSAGFYTALDDFGSGGVDFRFLAGGIRPDYVKVDMSLVKGCSLDRLKGASLADLVSRLMSLGASVVLEGVETAEDLCWITGQGWDVMLQGFALAVPGRHSEVFSPAGNPRVVREVQR